MSWGTIFLDFDNDGLLDILGAEGDLYHADSTEVIMQDLPIDFLRQTSSSSGTRFERVNERFGLIQLGSWRTVIAMDHNGDGVLDPLITDVEDRPLLFMSQGCTVNSWVEIIGQVGTRIEIEAGGVTQYAAIQSHSSFGGSHSPMAHIGLGRNKTIDRLILTSPNGEVYEATTPIEARRRISFISN